MPKKKRPSSYFASPAERRVKYDSRGEVMVARDRLKGALQDLVNSDEESSSSQEDSHATPRAVNILRREKDIKQPAIRRRKRKAETDLELAFQHTFVMKMFDRSVDLAQFKEDTPLYPICRAWIANQPRVPPPYPLPESPEMKTEEIEGMFDFESGVVRDVYKLPPPVCPPQPSRIATMEKPVLRGVSLDYSSDNLPSAQELLKEHLEKWGKTRQEWIKATQLNEQRFENSGKILANIFRRAQPDYG